MTFWDFANQHEWIALIMALIGCEALVRIIIVLVNRPLRHWNIRKHGYPPPHCDADGDFREVG